jgi:hypothetical protein
MKFFALKAIINPNDVVLMADNFSTANSYRYSKINTHSYYILRNKIEILKLTKSNKMDAASASIIIFLLSLILNTCTVEFLAANADEVEGLMSINTEFRRLNKLAQSVATSTEHSVDGKTLYSTSRARDDYLASYRRSRDQLLANERRRLSISKSSVAGNSNSSSSSRHSSRREKRGAIIRSEAASYQIWALPINYMIHSSFSGNTLRCRHLKIKPN